MYRPSPAAEYLLAVTAQHAPVLHQHAVHSITNYCTSTLGVQGVGRSYMRPDDAMHLAEALNIPFVGRAQALADPTGVGNRLVILDTGAGIDICCDYTYVVPGTERYCQRTVAGVGGVITARVEADFLFPVRLDSGGTRKLRRRALIVPEYFRGTHPCRAPPRYSGSRRPLSRVGQFPRTPCARLLFQDHGWLTPSKTKNSYKPSPKGYS
eukprot:scaffold18138_cov131-Isochrysis_galbana.AAC.4